jgi:hypothetical protein
MEIITHSKSSAGRPAPALDWKTIEAHYAFEIFGRAALKKLAK